MTREQFNTYYRKRTARLTLSVEDRENHPVRVWRTRYELSQKQMGALLGVSGSCVGYWERGISATPDWVLELCEKDADDYVLSKMAEVMK